MVLADVSNLLDQLGDLQREFLRLFPLKRAALISGQATRIDELTQAEAELVRRLQLVTQARTRLLQQHGGGCGSLTELVRQQADPRRETLLAKLADVRRSALELQHEAWIQWIVTQRCQRHYDDILELIACCGQTASTYSLTPRAPHTGGAVLDASV